MILAKPLENADRGKIIDSRSEGLNQGGRIADLLRSCGAALKQIGGEDQQVTGPWLNNRAEDSHPASRRRKCPLTLAG